MGSTPTRPDEQSEAETPQGGDEWNAWIRQVRIDADVAWKSGRIFYEVSFLWVPPALRAKGDGEDAAGGIETIEAVGWRLDHVAYVNVTQGGQASGIFDSAVTKVRGFYLFRRPAESWSNVNL